MIKNKYFSVSRLAKCVLVFWFYVFSNVAYSEPIILQSAQFSVIAQETLVLPDLNNDGTAELGFSYVSTPDNKVYLQVLNGKDLTAIRLISWVNIYVKPTFHIIADLNGNGVPEIGVFSTRNDGNNAGKAQLFTRDLNDGSITKVFNWPSNWTSAEALILDDLSGDGIVDVALQGRFKIGERPQLVVRNGIDSSSVDTFGYPDLFNAPRFFQHSDVNGDGLPEIATLGRIKRNNKIQVKIADGADSKNRLKAYNFPDKWRDVIWLPVGDKNDDGIEDWALFGTSRLDSRPQLIVKDGKSPRGAIRIFAWSGDLSSTSFHQVPDMNGDGVDEVAVGGVRSNGRFQFQVKDGSNRNVSLANHSLNLNITDVSFHVLSDLTGDGIAEIGFLGLTQSNQYQLIVQHGDGQSGNVIEYLFADTWPQKPRLDALNDINADGLNELLVWGKRLDDIKMQIWGIPDSDNDTYADTLDAFPNDNTEWLDTDKDTVGNNTDDDDDGDGLLDVDDVFPLISINGYVDTDSDGIPDDCNSQCRLTGMIADEDDNGNGILDIDEAPPEVLLAITSPQSLLTIGTSPVLVEGTIAPINASLILNGIEVESEDGVFSVEVALQEGANTIEARASFRGVVKTDTITVSLDKTPPNITIDSHISGQKVFIKDVFITGLVNDVVRGSIDALDANVTVNGVSANVSNRSYAASIELEEGENTIAVIGIDKVGNVNATQIQIVYEIPDGRNIELVSGQSQAGEISELLSEDLVIKVVDENQQTLEGVRVIYRVVQGDGTLFDSDDKAQRAVIVETDQNGEAATMYQIGTRVGQQNQKVRVTVVGIEANVVFTASAESAMASKITVNTGNNQRGSVGQRLPSPLVVYVTDDGANPVEGASVNFKVVNGDGYFKDEVQALTVSTNSDGFASAEYWLGETLGVDTQRIEAMLGSSSEEGLSSEFSATAYIPADPGNTTLSGIVLDTEANPLQGVTVLIEDSTRQAVTDETGYFNILEAPVGAVHLLVDGSTIENADGDYPTLGFSPVLVAGIKNTLQQPVYMVKLSDTNKALVSETQDAVVTMEDFPGYKLEIAANSATFPNGSKEGIVSISAVNSNRVPMAPPNGMQPQLAVTIQPSGTVFFPPAKITIPNLDGMEPGRQIDMYSFDHDLNEFVSIGLGTVTEDGSLIESNPGIGVLKAGWYIVPQPPEGDGTVEGDPDASNNPTEEPPEECGALDFSCQARQFIQDVADRVDDFIDDVTSCDEGEICDYIADSAQDFAESVGDTIDDASDRVADGIDNLIDSGTELVNETFDKIGDATEFVQEQAQRGLDPIIMATGELEFSQTDLKIPGRGFDFELKRTYRSKLHFNGRVGYNWVFNYYQLLAIPEAADANQNIIRSMENGLQYTYVANGDGSYTSPNSIFDVLRKNTDSTYTVRRPDGFKVQFNAQGEMTAHIDRYGNTMTFLYDDSERLSRVIDTLGREIVFSYRSDSGHIDTVTDFSGRSVRYFYDQDRNLIAARTPVVTGTPNDNDFVNGKFTQYTYSSGFDSDDAVLKHANHNLLSVTDAQGNVYLRNVYVNDPDSYQFDKIVEQQYGNESQVFVVTYEELNASEELTANLPRNLTTVIDRNGNLVEYTHNFGGMLLEHRQFTNRDVNENDSDVYVTSHEYNDDGLLLLKTLPEGNQAVYEYDSLNTLRYMQRNLLKKTLTPGARGSVQSNLITQYSYEPVYSLITSHTNRRGYSTQFVFDYQHEDNLVLLATELGISQPQLIATLSANDIVMNGGVPGQIKGNIVKEIRPDATLASGDLQVNTTERSYNRFGQLLEEIDPEGIVTQLLYYPENDPDGNGVVSDSEQALAADTGGYKSSKIVDARITDKRNRLGQALRITTSRVYDEVGNVVSQTDARGNQTQFVRNQLNQVVRKIAPAPFEYLVDHYYDANNNLVRTSQQNISTTSAALSGWVHTVYAYNSLNDKMSETLIPQEDEYLTTTYEYDANQNIVAMQQPEGNRVEMVFDERDLVYSTTRGAETEFSSTTTSQYDSNRNVIRSIDAEDHTGDDQNDVTVLTYDGYDRLIQSTDPLGNRKTLAYDANNNVAVEKYFGSSGIEGIDNKILLSETGQKYDELDRAYLRDDNRLINGIATDVGDGLTPDDNQVTVTRLFDANGYVTLLTDDNGNATQYSYDGLNRPVEVQDTNGNKTQTQYDANSNVIQVTRVQTNVDDVITDKSIESMATYDELNRKSTTTDALANTTVYRYDARNNVILVTDPLENLTLNIYDGINRLVQSRQYLTVSGAGQTGVDTTNPTNPDGIIANTYGYDGNSRLVFLSDDIGNVTTYQYDALNRQVGITYADDTSVTQVFDTDHNMVSQLDQNGSAFTHEYDGLNRLISTSVERADGVVGTTQWTFGYDGLSRRIFATDNNDPTIDSDDSRVEYRYDSLNHMLSESSMGLTTNANYDGLGNLSELGYPSGRQLDHSYDNVYNLMAIKDAAEVQNIVDYQYADNRVLERSYANGTTLSYINDATDIGYDGINRVLSKTHMDQNASLVSGFDYAYDKVNNRRFESDRVRQTADVYEYDSVYRLSRIAYQVPSDDETLLTITNNVNTNVDVAPIIAPQDESYLVDGVGNWVSVQTQLGSDSDAVGYQTNEMNEYNRIGANDQVHDSNGNLADDGSRKYLFDAKNRLVRLTTLGGNTISSYKYDAFGRRTVKRAGAETIRYIHFGKQVLEERNTFSQLIRQYVYGNGVDEVLQMRSASNDDFYYHENSIGSIAAITDSTGSVVERYQYNAYGETTIFAGDGVTQLTNSSIGNSYAYTGRRLDAVTDLYYYRARYYSPERGRFIQRDPLGYADGMGVYTYVGNNPINYVDPNGLMAKEAWDDAKDLIGDKYKDTTHFHFEGREVKNTNLPNFKGANKEGSDWVPLPKSQAIYHDNGVGEPEYKYVHPDGREAVYDGDTKKLITDPKYAGTYNYVTPIPFPESAFDIIGWVEFGDKGVGHIVTDVIPYLVGGNLRGDE